MSGHYFYVIFLHLNSNFLAYFNIKFVSGAFWQSNLAFLCYGITVCIVNTSFGGGYKI